MEYDSNQESDAGKGAGFSTEGALEHREEGNSTERSEQVSLCCEYAGREVPGGQEFLLWELAVHICAGSGNIKVLEAFAWEHKASSCLLLSPAAKEGKQ